MDEIVDDDTEDDGVRYRTFAEGREAERKRKRSSTSSTSSSASKAKKKTTTAASDSATKKKTTTTTLSRKSSTSSTTSSTSSSAKKAMTSASKPKTTSSSSSTSSRHTHQPDEVVNLDDSADEGDTGGRTRDPDLHRDLTDDESTECEDNDDQHDSDDILGDAPEDETDARLKQSMKYSVAKICERQSESLPNKPVLSTHTVSAIADLLYDLTRKQIARDLCSFSKHAKRQTITVDDVVLIARNNPSIFKKLLEKRKELLNKSAPILAAASKRFIDDDDDDDGFVAAGDRHHYALDDDDDGDNDDDELDTYPRRSSRSSTSTSTSIGRKFDDSLFLD